MCRTHIAVVARGILMSAQSALDDIDKRILLARDQASDAPSVELARIAGLSRNTVQARLKRLERGDALGAPSQRIRPSALGHQVLAFLTIELVQGRPRSVTDALKEIPEVLDVYAVSGDGDLMARVAARDNAHLYRVTQRVLRAPGVVRTRSMISVMELVPTRIGPLLRASLEDGVSEASDTA